MANLEAVPVSPVINKFIVQWGELGSRWGINRTVGQVHALLYLSPKPLDVQAICGALRIARSNASASLRELAGWGVVRSVHILGDRREHYEALGDVWEMLAILAQARKRREVDPTLAVLRECAEETRAKNSVPDKFVQRRIDSMLDLFETLSPLIDEFVLLPSAAVRGIVNIRGRLRSIFKAVK